MAFSQHSPRPATSSGPGLSRRSVLAGVGAGAAALALSACGGNDGGTGATGGGGLSQWYHQYGEDGVQEAVEQWAADYEGADVTVAWTLGDYASKLSSRLLSGSGVDVFENNQIDPASARKGLYADLTDLMDPVKSQFSEVALKPVTIDGKIWGVPMITDPQLLWYRPSLLEAAGVAVPTTFEELMQAGIALTRGDQKGLFVGNDGGAGVFSQAVPVVAGVGVLNADSTQVTFNTPEVAAGFAALQQAYQAGAMLVGSPTDWTDPTSFNAGLAAITWQGMWALPAMVEAFGDDLGVMAIPPVGGSTTSAVMVSQWNEQVAAKASDLEAAKALVKAQWIDDETFQKEFAVGFGFHVPPRTAVAAETTELQEGLAKQVVDLTDQWGFTAGPFWAPAMGTALTDAVTRIVSDGADPATELAAAQQAAQQTLDSLTS
ncbi:ABC transporter substrate-binding protein [Kineococcus sp. SYSU DK003]|uniref:ABC transporter substrate-binding protein n=1 Tax=Kineococcus sp. SYSU DK003 TaxID=3383124 RepID=UPI003D7CDE6A